MPETSFPTQIPSHAIDPTDYLPLSILRSDAIPPAPARSRSTIDWLPDFAGYSWVAYGASTLLVISHLPSPLSPDETLIGPNLRQVFELSGNPSSPVTAVSWSPVTPSIGELAAASENCICMFSHNSATFKGSFCWSQNAVLVQSSKVEAIEWTGSGDGIISGGIDVVLWRRRRRNRSWEIAWSFRRDHPQNLVSATWSIDGPSAAAACPAEPDDEESNHAPKHVLVCYGDGVSEYGKAELSHPKPISMIRWRPSRGRQSKRDGKVSSRHVLLTCCLDGTIRLWTEVDNGKARKLVQDKNDHKTLKRSFSVVAVVEVNQRLNGTLGVDVFFSWVTEIGGLYRTGEGANQFFSTEGNGHDRVGRCEWLIGFGPGTLVTFWSIHCLDDISPTRFPRVRLWKRQELPELEIGHLQTAGFLSCKDWILLNKVVISRDCLSGPPNICSLIHLLPCNSLVWSLLYTQTSSNVENAHFNDSMIEKYLSCSSGGVLNGGHTGKILQVAVHPRIYEVELAVSLDSNGLLLFWLVSTLSNYNLGLSRLIPAWKLCGKLVTSDSCSKYTSLRWAPSIFGEDYVLLVGHSGGIDFFMVKISLIGEDEVICHYTCTIPLAGHGPYEDGPSDIFAISLPSTCNKTFKNNKFLLLGVWLKGFQALSWEVTIHSYDLQQNGCECNFDYNITPCKYMFESTFADKRYCLGVNPCSSWLPEPYSHDEVTSFSVVCPGNLMPMQESLGIEEDLFCSVPAYTMATGCSDGSLKLWRCKASEQSTHIPWELVGKFIAHEGPVSALCLSDCGQKIATISAASDLDGDSILHIWDTVHLMGAGNFMLEDRLSIKRDVVALNWLTLGNGQLLLGVCMQDELQVYAQKCSGGQILLSPGKSLNLHYWSCIAVANLFSAIRDFLWGPLTTAVIVHDNYFSLLGPWSFLLDSKQQSTCVIGEDCNGKGRDVLSSIFADHDIDIGDLKELSVKDSSGEYNSQPHMKIHVKNDCVSSSLSAARAQLRLCSGTTLGFWSLVEIAEKLRGPLPIYHPVALFINTYSGNWKRSYTSVKHLVGSLTSSFASEKRYSSAKHSPIVPQIFLSNYFDGPLLKDSTEEGLQWSTDARLHTSSSESFVYNSTYDASNNMFGSASTKSELSAFVEPLEKFYNLAGLTNNEKLQILAIIDLLSEVQHSSSAYKNLDEPAQRFWVTLRFQQLLFFRSFGRSPSAEELVADSRMISWAFHSDCQEALLNSFLPNEPSWKEMQTLGMGFWFTNVAQLRSRMEKLARLQYLRKKDPKDCALLYIVLNRVQVLAGLFKISKDEKDKPLVGFLSRNFQEEKNKAAALKNAYVLMGRHQLELAIAFFLLGGDTYSAITICAKNYRDEQLAFVICRLVEGCGGPLEHYLITKLILPSANERGDYWLANLLEWELGNYSRSFQRMLGFEESSVIEKSAFSSNHVALMDPHIGLYCLALASKNSMRTAIGEQNAAILGRLATFMTAAAFNRCGLPLEALECLSSSLSTLGVIDQGSVSDVDHSQTLHAILKPSAINGFNWLSSSVALHLESHVKLDLALQYFSKLMGEHPSWPNSIVDSVQIGTCSKDCRTDQYEKLLENFQEKLHTGLSKFEQKFSLATSCVIKMILLWLCNNGLSFIGGDILLNYNSQNHLQSKSHIVGGFIYPLLHKPHLKSIQDISLLLSRFITSCSITCFQPKSCYLENDISVEVKRMWSDSQGFYFQGILQNLQSLRAAIRTFSCSSSEDVTTKTLDILDLFEYYLYFASFWLQRNSKGLLLMVQPLFITLTNGHTPYAVDMTNLKDMLHRIADLSVCDLLTADTAVEHAVAECVPNKQDGKILQSFSEDEKWHVIGVCLWQHMSKFMKHTLDMLSIKVEDNCSSAVSYGKVSSWSSCSTTFVLDGNSLTEKIASFSLILAKLLKLTLIHISSHYVKLLGSFLQQEIENGIQIPILLWLENYSLSRAKALYQDVSADIMNSKDESSTLDILWDTCADPNKISEGFAQEKINWSQFFNLKFSKGWIEEFMGSIGDHETKEIFNHEVGLSNCPSTNEAGSPTKGLFRNGRTFLNSWQKDATATGEVSYFQTAKEAYKRDGELLEALCTNSINEWQAAVASNRKGIAFFSWKDRVPFREQSDYLWSGADWPSNGWAGAESIPVPTCVSPGVGLGSKKGTHLGLGGATIGVGSFAGPARKLTSNGAFGIPGYAGIGASGLGWEVQQDFEEFVAPPATVYNIRTRALSSHPSRPFFLVGSGNTLVYLWEFGKEKATATYGVLPAANVPPPYALASISALQFDHCGHRFATAALDGTVCTWQLEVGGRSNIHPTESSLCFNGHASDVTYITSSGSVIAATGCSSNSVNVVIWDTLAPSTTSRAPIICHEGGARSISVFDNDIGSGSISPLIITGGKGGDVGLHDFRYIATGRTKRHKHFDSSDAKSNTASNSNMQMELGNKFGDPNLNGMLWYIPNAHLGSVTKICTIPHTSLFLTGSKDGDVKLWDAKTAKLVCHWPKLHERRTFLQPSSRSFGGVVRAGVTDIQVVSHGFLTCGGDGSVKMIQIKDYQQGR